MACEYRLYTESRDDAQHAPDVHGTSRASAEYGLALGWLMWGDLGGHQLRTMSPEVAPI
jgi:hypothetical protein